MVVSYIAKRRWEPFMEQQFIYGDRVRVTGLRGEFNVHSTNADGSICIYGGTFTHQQFHNVYPERIRKVVKKVGKR